MNYHGGEIPEEALTAFCRRHRIRRRALFGSILREDFGPASDVDVLVESEPGARAVFAFSGMQDELSSIFGRRVDLNTPCFLSKYFREEALREARALHEATCRHSELSPEAIPGRREAAERPSFSVRPALEDARQPPD